MSQPRPTPNNDDIKDSAQREFIVQTCTYIFSLVASYSTSLYLFVIVSSIAAIHLCLLPKIWPGNTLPLVAERIRKVESLLHDETARRRNTVTAIICARGLARLDTYVKTRAVLFCSILTCRSIRARSICLLDQHCDLRSFRHAHRYIRVMYSLYQGSRRCLQDVEALLTEVEKQVCPLAEAPRKLCDRFSDLRS